jgi:hypothetical protein
MATLTPVEQNPFGTPQGGGGRRLSPVQGNPFEAAPLRDRLFDKPEDEALYQTELAKITEERTRPRAPTPDDEFSPEDLAKNRVMQLRGRELGEQQFEASRTPLKRVTDASTFALSAIPRALTGGRHGLGDVAGLVSEEAGETYNQAEADFARANRGWLEPVAKVGEATIGIPFLQSMGGVPGQMLRTSRAAAAPVMNRLLPQRAAPRAAPVATPEQAYGPAQRIIDRQAFVDEGIPEFAPAFGSKGLARTGRTIEEVPLVGGTVKVPKTAVEQAMLERQRNVASQAGAAASQEEVGRISQGGLSRFRGSNLEDLERSRVQGLGLTPDRPPAARGGNVTIDRPSQLNTAQMTDDQLKAAAASRVDLPGSKRSRVEDLTPQEVQKIVSLPARDTSFATKASALYKQAEDAVPALMKSNAAVNPGLIATRNAGGVAKGLLTQEKSARVSGGVLHGRFGQLVQDLKNPKSNFTLDTLRAARTEIGRALDSFGQFETGLDRKQLKALYGSVSDDYQAGLVALAARARTAARANRGDQSALATANAADKALHRYRVADRYYRNGIERMDRFMSVLGADTLEQASKRIASYLRENTQNIRSLESMSSSLRPEEWRAVLGNVVEQLGKLTPGAREAERIFSFERYATDWAKISQNPRVMALFRRSLGDATVRSLENMGRIAERMKRYESTRNYSGSAYTAGAGASLAMVLTPGAWPLLIAGIAGPGVVGKVITSKAFASWVNSMNRAQVRVGSSVAATKQAARPHLQRLARLAAKEPDLEVAAAMSALGVAIEQQLEAATRPETSQAQ